MAVTPKRLMTPSQLTAVAALYYTAKNVRTILKACTFCNTTGDSQTVTVYIVPSGGTAGVTNTILDAVSVPANGTLTGYELLGHVLLTGDTIWALSDAGAAITMHLSGMEVA